MGAAFGCLVPRLVSGEFDPDAQKAVWPSTGNYCRGGAFDGALLGCTAIAILPEQMSQERFTWLSEIGAEVIATPGCESNVKEIYDKCWELKRDPANVIFNQFDEFGNPIFHYNVTGPAIEDVFDCAGKRRTGGLFISATGSAGTIAAGIILKNPLSALAHRGDGGAAVPDAVWERLWRAPDRRHRRQARAVGTQRPQHRRRGGD